MISRREFFKIGAAVGASMALPIGWLAKPQAALAFSQSDNLKKFVQPLRMAGADIPLAQKDVTNPGWWQPGVDHYTIDVAQFEDQLHPDLPNPTRLWGFGQGTTSNFRHLGGIIAAKRDHPVQITFRNHLPPTHIIPVDSTIMGVMGNQMNRTDIHLHGGHVPWTSDGGPHAWWDPDGHKGPSFLNNQVLRPGQIVPNNEAEYYYPNDQGARLAWYHDHSFGITRINAYAGIASAYVIYDDYELELVATSHMPGPLDPRTIYLAFQDKILVTENIATSDPTWNTIMPASRPGDLWYAHEYDPSRWDVTPGFPPTPNPSVIPEFFGDTILVNGTVYPVLEVEQRQYRFRLLNACNARFLNPHLLSARGTSFPDTTEPQNAYGPPFIQFGTEGGFLPYPVMLNDPAQSNLLLAPAERADLIVDFRDFPDGTIFLLCNDAPAPYPMGDDIDDYHPGNPSTPVSTPGFGPDTRTLLQIKVKARIGPADAPISLPSSLTPTDQFLVNQMPFLPTPAPAGARVRWLTLNETNDEYGRLIQYLGTDEPVNPGAANLLFGRPYQEEPTEVVAPGDIEVWNIINLTGDTHPIHFHLVNVQVLSRMLFDPNTYAGGVPDVGPARGPDINEMGWKETVRMNPNEVTSVIMKFDLPVVPFTVPDSPRTGGAEYVWHCHILEHEEHDMMRPLVVKQNKIFLPLINK
jgi:spore coat protein A